MNEETKTPRTDGALLIWNLHGPGMYNALHKHSLGQNGENINRRVVLADFARQLERELTLVTQERDMLRKKLDETPPAPSKDGMSKRERKLVKAIVNIKDRIPDISVRDWAKEQLEEALAAYEGKEEGK